MINTNNKTETHNSNKNNSLNKKRKKDNISESTISINTNNSLTINDSLINNKNLIKIVNNERKEILKKESTKDVILNIEKKRSKNSSSLATINVSEENLTTIKYLTETHIENNNNNSNRDQIILPLITKNVKSNKNLTKITKIEKKTSKQKLIPTSNYKDYEEIENKKLILSYGPQVYNYSIRNESNYCLTNTNSLSNNIKEKELRSFNLLKNHEITPEVRTKLADWLFEVINAYNSEENTIYLTFHLLDSFISKSKTKLSNSDIHLLGITSLFIASKTEDIVPIDLHTVKVKIGHNKFNGREIKNKEKQILEALDFCIFITSMYDFIKNFIFDFVFNNKKTISKLKLRPLIALLERTAIYVSKILLHSEYFTKFRNSLKAISCIIVAFDLIRSNNTNNSFNTEMFDFIHEWINFLIEQSRYDPSLISSLYNDISEYYIKFDSILLINHNLKKTSGVLF